MKNLNKDVNNHIIINASKIGNLEVLRKCSHEELRDAQCNVGCTALHWAAGSNQIEVVQYLLSAQYNSSTHDSNNSSEKVDNDDCVGKMMNIQISHAIFDNVNLQVASRLAKGRTPLHYACRNGHLKMVKILIAVFKANPTIKAKKGVTPFQLAIWQNHIHICKHLVQECGIVASEDVNEFGCGAIHWLGIVPYHRANVCDGDDCDDNEAGQDGEALMPLAKWLISQPNIDAYAKQNQGHSVLHKAAWGGHLTLVRYLHEQFDMYDNCTDVAGNYAADICDMMHTKRHDKVALYLRRECSIERQESLRVLGLQGQENITTEEIRKAYLEKAKVFHPDSQNRERNSEKHNKKHDFNSVRKAYEHLTNGGIATKQKNPSHSIELLLEMQSANSTTHANLDNTQGGDDLFKARLLAVLLEYGDKGLNLSNIPSKWNQIWGPDAPLDTFFDGGKRRPGALLKMIRSCAIDVVKIVRMKPQSENERKSNRKGIIKILPRSLTHKDIKAYVASNNND
jgi:hypothetical protein